MDEKIQRALRRDRTIDITTTGRKTGKTRRIEIWFYRADGRIYLSGSPGRRGWYANLLAEPHFTFHLKQSAKADLPALAVPITDENERRRIFAIILADMKMSNELEEWVSASPLAEVVFEG